MSVSIFGNIASIYLIFAYSGSASMIGKLALLLLVVSVNIYAILNAKSVREELDELRKDEIAELNGTNYLRHYRGLRMAGFQMLATIVFTALGVAQALVLYGL
jgi:hypothetical protein